MRELVGTEQVAVTQTALNSSTATLICALRPSRHRVMVQNTHATDIAWVGNSDVTTSKGIRVSPGLTVEIFTRSSLYAISTANTPSVAVLEEF